MKKLIFILVIFLFPLFSNAYVTQNTLSIPRLEISQRIAILPTIKGLGNYIWHRPNSSTPDQGGNSVFVAHRMITIPFPMKATFGTLPKVTIDDVIEVNWGGKLYKYKVYETKIVRPADIEVEFNTDEPIITLYTCVYTLTGKDRFVVRAKLLP